MADEPKAPPDELHFVWHHGQRLPYEYIFDDGEHSKARALANGWTVLTYTLTKAEKSSAPGPRDWPKPGSEET